MEQPRARRSKGRWYILVLISLMYLITYLDRVNISTAAPVISKEFGFDKITMGVIFSAFVWAYALFQVPGGWISDRFGAAQGPHGYCRLLVGHDGGDGSGHRRDLVHRASLSVRRRRRRRLSRRDARHAALVSEARARICAGHHPQREPARCGHRAAAGRCSS